MCTYGYLHTRRGLDAGGDLLRVGRERGMDFVRDQLVRARRTPPASAKLEVRDLRSCIIEIYVHV